MEWRRSDELNSCPSDKSSAAKTCKNGDVCTKCVLCFKNLSNECLKPSKLEPHLKQTHRTKPIKTVDFGLDLDGRYVAKSGPGHKIMLLVGLGM